MAQKGGPSRSKKHKVHVIKHHHAKPVRTRHLGLLVTAFMVTVLSVFQLGVLYGGLNQTSTPNTTNIITAPSQSLLPVRSSLGFAFAVDRNVFRITATEVDDKGKAQSVAEEALRENRQIVSATVTPSQANVSSRDAVSRLSIQVDTTAASATNDVLADRYAPKSDAEFDIKTLVSSNEKIDQIDVTRRVYEYTAKFGNPVSTSVYSIVWTGTVNDKPLIIKLQGLIGSSEVPAIYSSLFDTFSLGTSQTVSLGEDFLQLSAPWVGKVHAQDKQLDEKYLADKISPAVVKIYYVACGKLVLAGVEVPQEQCHAGTGSGFMVSRNGHVATNGHVVVFEPEDAFVKLLLSSPQTFASFLRATGNLSDAQINTILTRPELIASIVAQLYELPDDDIKFASKREAALVALGSKPVELKSVADLDKMFDFSETQDIKKAEIMGFNFSGKDAYNFVSGSEEGFTSSDVALLKIGVPDAPVIKLASSSQITQNQKITILGFPGDAENELVNNDKLDVTVTNGNVSAIKDAVGDSGSKLFQTDADASQGNSGGPAVTDQGEAFGLLTYRFKDSTAQNAAKSYLRDIADFKKLADSKNVTLDTASTTQASWDKGLRLFSENRFSKAKKEFEKVKKTYPAHRLADTYIASANENIAAGKDVKDFPVLLVVLIGIGLGGTAIGVVLIVRHRGHHEAYKMAYGAAPLSAMQPAQGMPPVAPTQQPIVSPATVQPVDQPIQQPVQQPVYQQPGPIVVTPQVAQPTEQTQPRDL